MSCFSFEYLNDYCFAYQGSNYILGRYNEYITKAKQKIANEKYRDALEYYKKARSLFPSDKLIAKIERLTVNTRIIIQILFCVKPYCYHLAF